MESAIPDGRNRITIAILALGGEGGGVLADWILDMANKNGFVAQGTSVPGVAQRTGSTIYYIEMMRRAAADKPEPVLAMMPLPGDVDIVIASELMEAGRAVLRGFVSKDRTTLIGSTHRVYAISEKSAAGDGRSASERIFEAAERHAKRFVSFDMAEAASACGSVISAIMFGALAESGALPFPREAFEAAIRHGGKAIESNLKGLDLGAKRASGVAAEVKSNTSLPPAPTTETGRILSARIAAQFPGPVQPIAVEGVRRLMDYQDRAYAELYLKRLAVLHTCDDGREEWRLTREAARHIALWMSYEDTIRVADLKVRAARFARVAQEARAMPDQILCVTDYMHPRLREVCETLPTGLGRRLLKQPTLNRLLEPLFAKGRHVETTSIRWFLLLRLLAAMRSIRRSTLRYAEEQKRIEDWLAFVRETTSTDRSAATELIVVQGLIKGYSDTFERGLARFDTIMREARSLIGRADAADRLRQMREAALADESGEALKRAVLA